MPRTQHLAFFRSPTRGVLFPSLLPPPLLSSYSWAYSEPLACGSGMPESTKKSGVEMPYQYVSEPLTADESDRLSNACETPTERLVVWTLLDTGLRVSELCGLTSKNVLGQQRTPVQGQGRPLWREDQGPRGTDVPPRAGMLGAPLRAGEGIPVQASVTPGVTVN